MSLKTRMVADRTRRTPPLPQIRIGFDPQDIHDARNIVPLCRHHHDAIELGILTRQLRWALDENETMHIERVAGPEWLDAHYPKD